MDNDEIDKLLRNHDPLLYDSVMKELTEINSLKEFWDKVLIIDKRDIGSETPYIFNLVFDNRIWNDIQSELNLRLYSGGDIIKGLLAIAQIIQAEYEHQSLKENIKNWMHERLTNFNNWVSYHVEEELIKRKHLRDKPQTFKDLFKPDYRNHSETFKQVLRDVTPALINEDSVWIKNKNIARLFYDRMVLYKVMDDVDRKHVAKLFAVEFSGFKAATFQDNYDSEHPPTSHGIYLEDLNYRIKALKATIDNE